VLFGGGVWTKQRLQFMLCKHIRWCIVEKHILMREQITAIYSDKNLGSLKPVMS
jgi:hypothetical protein